MGDFNPIYPPGFRPTDGFGPGGPGPGREPPQTVNSPQQPQPTQQSQLPASESSMTMTMASLTTAPNPPNQPPVILSSSGISSSTDAFNIPSQSIISGASVTSLGSSPTDLTFQPSSAISTLFNSQTAGSSIASVATSIIALSTTTLTAIPNPSESAAIAAGGSAPLTSSVPEPVLRDQTIVGVAVGIGVWLVIVIAVLSCCLWRKRKILRGMRLADETTGPDPDMEETAAMVRPPIPQRAPSLPPPFLSRSVSTIDDMPPPLGSHPVSRAGRNGAGLSLFSSEEGRVMDEQPESPGFPGRTPSPRNSDAGSTTHRSIVKMRPLSTDSQNLTSPDHISELPPSLGKLNSWLEENRRRSRMEASGSVNRTSSNVLSSGGPTSRPMSLASLKEVYRKSASMESSTILAKEISPGTPPK